MPPARLISQTMIENGPLRPRRVGPGRVHGKKRGPPREDDPVRLKSALVAGEGFEPSTFGLCAPLQLSLPGNPVRGPDFLFILGPALPPLGCLPLSLYTFCRSAMAPPAWLGVTPLPASPNLTGDRTEVSFCTAHSLLGGVANVSSNQRITPHGIEPNELPDCSTPQWHRSEASRTKSNNRT